MREIGKDSNTIDPCVCGIIRLHHLRNPYPFSMFEGVSSPSSSAPAGATADDPMALLGHLMRVLDEVDYGLMLFRPDRTFWHANHLARAMLGRGDRLFLDQGQLKARVPTHQPALQTGFARAAQGIRCLLNIASITDGGADTAVALVPMAHPAEWAGGAVPVLLIACRPSLCAPLSLRFFAQAHGLTRMEECVLTDLVQGQEVEDIARHHNMAVSTARSHVKQLRQKTRSTSMRELLGKVAVLPPVVSAIRSLGS